MKKKSLIQQIINAATINPNGVTAAQIKNAVPNTKNAVSVALWKLKRYGVLTHDPKTGVYKLTDVNKSVAPDVTPAAPAPAPAKPKAKTITTVTSDKSIKEYQATLKRADESYADLAARMMNLRKDFDGLRERHEDALAIIRYLEDKMFKVIQFDARRGNA
jgi:hypothetical protein